MVQFWDASTAGEAAGAPEEVHPAVTAIWAGSSRMGNDQKSRSPPQRAIERLLQVFRIQGREALVQNHHTCPLQKSPRHEQAAAARLGELPAGFADDLLQGGGHASEEVSLPSSRQTAAASAKFPNGRSPLSHQQVKGEGLGRRGSRGTGR